MVENGQQVVLLDDLIIDIKNYTLNHPGGKKVLTANIGRDISKFFYGGYQYENFKGKNDIHTHSAEARALCQEMVIGVLEKNYASEFSAKLSQVSEQVGTATNTFIFKSNEARVGVQTYYSDINMIGKHSWFAAQRRKACADSTLSAAALSLNFTKLIKT